MAQLDSSVFDSVPIDPRGNAQPFSPRLTIEKRGVSRLTFSIDNNHRSIEFLSASFPNTALLPWEDYDRRGRVQNECGISYTCAPKSPIRPVHPGKELLDDGRDTIHRRIDICIYIYIWDDGSRRLKQRKRERVPDVDLRLLTVKKQSKYISQGKVCCAPAIEEDLGRQILTYFDPDSCLLPFLFWYYYSTVEKILAKRMSCCPSCCSILTLHDRIDGI